MSSNAAFDSVTGVSGVEVEQATRPPSAQPTTASGGGGGGDGGEAGPAVASIGGWVGGVVGAIVLGGLAFMGKRKLGGKQYVRALPPEPTS